MERRICEWQMMLSIKYNMLVEIELQETFDFTNEINGKNFKNELELNEYLLNHYLTCMTELTIPLS